MRSLILIFCLLPLFIYGQTTIGGIDHTIGNPPPKPDTTFLFTGVTGVTTPSGRCLSGERVRGWVNSVLVIEYFAPIFSSEVLGIDSLTFDPCGCCVSSGSHTTLEITNCEIPINCSNVPTYTANQIASNVFEITNTTTLETLTATLNVLQGGAIFGSFGTDIVVVLDSGAPTSLIIQWVITDALGDPVPDFIISYLVTDLDGATSFEFMTFTNDDHCDFFVNGDVLLVDNGDGTSTATGNGIGGVGDNFTGILSVTGNTFIIEYGAQSNGRNFVHDLQGTFTVTNYTIREFLTVGTDTPDNITYTVSSVTNATFNPPTFTQQDINDRLVELDILGDPVSYTVVVTDSFGNSDTCSYSGVARTKHENFAPNKTDSKFIINPDK